MTTRIGVLAAVAVLLGFGPALAQQAQGQAHGHAHVHGEKEQSVYDGYFQDAQVADRPLSDWAGDWQSVYPLLQAGALDDVMAHKARQGDKTAQEYRAYYQTGYQTDVDRIQIDGATIAFHGKDGVAQGRYASDGHEILTYQKGNRGVRFIFRKTDGDAAAPQFVQFSDHAIAPVKAGHYHLYWGNDRAALLQQMTNWPTYYPLTMSPAQIAAEMQAH